MPENGEGPVTFSNGVVRPEYIRDGNMAGFSFGNGQQALIGAAGDPDSPGNVAFQERLRKSISDGMYDRRPARLTPQQIREEEEIKALGREFGLNPLTASLAVRNPEAFKAVAATRKDSGSGGYNEDLEAIYPEDPATSKSLAMAAKRIAKDPNAPRALKQDPGAAALLDHIARTTNNAGGWLPWGNDTPARQGYMHSVGKNAWWNPFSEDMNYNRGGEGNYGLDTDQFDSLPSSMQSRLWALLRALETKPPAPQ